MTNVITRNVKMKSQNKFYVKKLKKKKHNIITRNKKQIQYERNWRHLLETSIQDTAATQGSTTATNQKKKKCYNARKKS